MANKSEGMKWVVGVLISLVAAGGSIVAVLNYLKSPPRSDDAAVQPRIANSPGATPTGNSNTQPPNKAEPSPARTPELRLNIKTEEDMCKLVEFLQFQTRHVVYLRVDFIRSDSGGITDPGNLGAEPASVTIQAQCARVTPEAERFILQIDSGSYFWGRDDPGDGWILEGQFYSKGVKHVGQGYFALMLTPKT
jgi:hypothetical protein